MIIKILKIESNISVRREFSHYINYINYNSANNKLHLTNSSNTQFNMITYTDFYNLICN